MGGSKIITLYNTIKYLKPIQIYYRLYYIVRNRLFKNPHYKHLNTTVAPINWKDTILNPNSFLDSSKFRFLNLEKNFAENINWDYQDFGKLWTFNLNYFDFLNQKNIDVVDAVRLIKDYIAKDTLLIDGKAAYPISLRGINWIKFIGKNNISDNEINGVLYNHYQILSKNVEYHLLGNHLLENGFAFLFGAYHFKDKVFYKQAIKILKKELKEQTLNDGGHFELSPMYHQTMLFRVLDCIQLVKLNPWKKDDLLPFLEDIAIKMLSWLEMVTFENGDIPMVNDSSFGIAPITKELVNYGKQLGIQGKKVKLSDSGYRMFKNNKYELFIDVGQVGASYQPAHVHSDTFNFILYVNKQPVFVDRGISTYEKNELRQKERSTSSHNTVQIGNMEQTQVWGGFRVAKRAKVINLREDIDIEATHDGYKNINHTRTFSIKDDLILISDTFSKEINNEKVAYFHLHPTIKNIFITNSRVSLVNENIGLSFKGGNICIVKESYRFATGFNSTLEAIKLKILFDSSLETTIQL